jgi:peptidyl-prolyl cis-trans isomerase SurA
MLFAIALTVLPVPSQADMVDQVIATIDGTPVTQSDLERYVGERGGTEEPTREDLANYVTEELLRKEAKAHGVQVDEAQIEAYIAQVKAQRGLTDAQFEAALEEQGLTVDVYRREVGAELEKGELMNREIRNRVSVSNEQVRRYYDAHEDDFALAERVRLRMILIPLPADAPPEAAARAEVAVRVLHAKLEGGESFGEMARQFSAGPGAEQGGDLGFFERGQMVKPLEDVAFRLKAGSISHPIRSPAGFHILKVEEREGSVEQSFEAVAEMIREQLYQQELQERYERWLRAEISDAHHVEILW